MILKFLFFSVLFVVSTSFSQELEFQIEWRFKHLVKGFSYTNQLKVEIDGIEQHESGNFSQSELGIARFSVLKGIHRIKVTDCVFYAGKWEAHSLQNDYALDAIYDSVVSFDSGIKLKLIFDIQKSRVKASWKQFQVRENLNSQELNAIWNFSGVKEGYNLPCRMRVYIDHQLVHTSEVFLQTQPGKLTFFVSKGKHDMQFKIESFYDHQWEEMTRPNNYSIDAAVRITKKVKETEKLVLNFNLESESTQVEWK